MKLQKRYFPLADHYSLDGNYIENWLEHISTPYIQQLPWYNHIFAQRAFVPTNDHYFAIYPIYCTHIHCVQNCTYFYLHIFSTHNMICTFVQCKAAPMLSNIFALYVLRSQLLTNDHYFAVHQTHTYTFCTKLHVLIAAQSHITDAVKYICTVYSVQSAEKLVTNDQEFIAITLHTSCPLYKWSSDPRIKCNHREGEEGDVVTNYVSEQMQLQLVSWPVVIITRVINLLGKYQYWTYSLSGWNVPKNISEI